jgi:hypothetical protein
VNSGPTARDSGSNEYDSTTTGHPAIRPYVPFPDDDLARLAPMRRIISRHAPDTALLE